MVLVLLPVWPWAALLYLLAAVAAFLYHWHREQRWVTIDHGLAWAAIGCNCWLAWQAQSSGLVGLALCAIAAALVEYRASHLGDEIDYLHHHTLWHLWCGVGGLLLALAQ